MPSPEANSGEQVINPEPQPRLETQIGTGEFYSLKVTYDLNQPSEGKHILLSPISATYPDVIRYPVTAAVVTDTVSPDTLQVDISTLVPPAYSLYVVRLSPAYIERLRKVQSDIDEDSISPLMPVSPLPVDNVIGIPLRLFTLPYNNGIRSRKIDESVELLLRTIGIAREQDWDKQKLNYVLIRGYDFTRQILHQIPKTISSPSEAA